MIRNLLAGRVKGKFFSLGLVLQLVSLFTYAQTRISGTVTGADGKGLPTIAVQVQGTNTGAFTGADGKYELTGNLKNGSYTLIFSSIGFKPVEKKIDVNGSTPITADASMVEDVLGLDEIVVTGNIVATSKKRLTNAISTVSSKEIQNTAATGIDGALQGKVAGATISQNSGNPAGGISVRLRGPSSIVGSSDPLYIVDGVIVNNESKQLIDLGGYAQNRLVDLNPADIDRIEVIKGAAASAIYGSRASNGVVQIFTKKGKTGAPQIAFNTAFKTNSVRKKLEYNEYPFRFNNATVTDTTKTAVQRYDYQDDIFHTGIGTDNSLSVAGGTDATHYYIGLSNFYNEGIIKNTNFNRNGLRVNLSQKLGKIFTLSGGANYTLSSSNEIPNGGITEAYGALTGFIFANNFVNPEKDPVTGIYPSTAPTAILRRTNPLEAIDRFKFRQKVNRFIGSLQLNAKPIEGLNIDYVFGLDNYTQISTAYIPPKNTTPSYDGGFSQTANATVLQTNNDLSASYRKKVNSWLESTTGIGGTMQYDRLNTLVAKALQLGTFGETVNNGTATVTENRTERSIMGGYLQETIGLFDKIYLTGAARLDASSVYSPDNRWQFYPKVSGAYLLSEEDFWRDSKLGEVMPLVKIRAAWGESGNLTAIGAYDRYSLYSPVNYSGSTGYITAPLLGNTNIQPERQREFEVGADLSFLKDRISVEFSYYNKDIQDMILNRTLAPSTAYNNRFQNVGVMKNKGIEVMLKAVAVNSKDFQWVTTLSYTHNTNVINGVEGNGILPFAGGFGQVAAVNGYALGAFYSTFYARNTDGSLLLTPGGLPQRERGVQGANGTYTTQRDANGQPSGTILSKVIGDPNPKHIVSWINDLNYKKFSLRMQWDGMLGFDVFNFTRRVGDNANYGGLKGYEAELKGQVPKGTSAALFSIFENWIEKGDFVKLRELSLAYNLVPDAGRLKNLRIVASGRNLFSIDNYSGYDPEINAAGQDNAVRGFDFVEVPLPRTFQLGLNVNF
ncbi:SusC/RagA family TonB-linked outer membrane protein [uncultured Chitinophaga sp.]|uniref:SusC/RagA family TonB-linked outer membrane protein n=1 Tax=uncultured Chitinophaga sp. TaxID=339340 RepID=UPI0025D7F2BC|nr:SusC/RagA family TonB-linked outer membrane protein [uncultured Chitinophaga sp.]